MLAAKPAYYVTVWNSLIFVVLLLMLTQVAPKQMEKNYDKHRIITHFQKIGPSRRF